MSKPDGAAELAHDTETESTPAPRVWEPVWDFVVHGVVGTLILLIVAGFAVLIDLLVRWVEARHAVSAEILQG